MSFYWELAIESNSTLWVKMSNAGKRRKVARKFKEQGGLCWICGEPMLPLLVGAEPNRWSATLDHLEYANTTNGRERSCQVAHQYCNVIRGQGLPDIKHIQKVRKWFSESGWRKGHYERPLKAILEKLPPDMLPFYTIEVGAIPQHALTPFCNSFTIEKKEGSKCPLIEPTSGDLPHAE